MDITDIVASLYQKALARHHAGEIDQAEFLYRRILLLEPSHLNSLQLLGVVAYQRDRPELALCFIGRAIVIDDKIAVFHSNISAALVDLDMTEEAFQSGRRAVLLDPGAADGYVNLGAACRETRRLTPAERHGRQAIQINPHSPTAYNNFGLTLRQLGRHQQALASLRAAVAVAPSNAKALQNLAMALMDLGRLEMRAVSVWSLRAAPGTVKFLRNFADMHRFQTDDEWMQQLLRLEVGVAQMTPPNQIAFHFAMAKALEDIGERDRSFAHLLAGNRLKRQALSYDEQATLAFIERLQAVFTPALFAERGGKGNLSSDPIFIVGLPRSGTTLIEQILASHPRVFGAGELSAFSRSLYGKIPAAETDYPEIAATISVDQMKAVGDAYLHTLADIHTSPEVRHITDKLPGNLLFAGIIHLALPNARIIQLQRDPVDTCLSCFSKQFSGDLNYTYDLGELGRYARASLRLMEHWQKVLPARIFLSVRYEDVVADVEAQSRRLLDFCGLPWTDAVLSFHKTERAVRTASVNQVRQPIYRSSIGRWRPAPDLLAPLLDGLER